MDYENKYKQLHTLISDLYPFMSEYCKEKAEGFLPELKESEDEKIRKALIDIVAKSPITFAFEDKEKVLAWLEKQGKIVDYYEDRLDECACKYFNKGYKQALEKQGKQKPAEEYNITGISSKNAQGKLGEIIKNLKTTWSEKDEVGLANAMWAIEQARTIAKDENDMGNLWYAERWLKSIKDRVRPQPKQEWSMYDETILKSLIDHFEYKKEFNEAEDYDIVLWLKSLRPQNRWKPSDEQMDELRKHSDNVILRNLYYSLKKLKS